MKIWGVAASRRRTDGTDGTSASASAPAAPAEVAPPPQPESFQPCKRPQNISDAGLRALARLRREFPVDLRLDGQELRSAADVQAVLEACSDIKGDGEAGVKTLVLGPWGADPSCHSISEDCDSADGVLHKLAFMAPATWAKWPLRGFTVCELRLRDAKTLASSLRYLPKELRVLRLQRLGSLRGEGLRQCLDAACSDGDGTSCHRQLKLLDLSGNGLDDKDVEILVGCISKLGDGGSFTTEGLVLTGNAAITYTGFHGLLSAACVVQHLAELDLSECGVGPAGAGLLEQLLRNPACQLRELTLYRCGINPEGMCGLVSAAAQSTLRSLNLTANGQHCTSWQETLGKPIAALLSQASLRVLTISCPEKELEAAAKLFAELPTRVILVPNEQNNYNRALFLGDD